MGELTQHDVEKAKTRDQRQRGGKPAAQAAPVPLSVMLGQGMRVTLGDTEYELTRFSLGQMGQAGKYLSAIPNAFLAAAAAGAETGQFHAEKMADWLNKLHEGATGNAIADENKVTSGAANHALRVSIMDMDEKEADALAGVIAVAASRKHPGLDAKQMAETMDIDQALEALRVVFVLNPRLPQSF